MANYIGYIFFALTITTMQAYFMFSTDVAELDASEKKTAKGRKAILKSRIALVAFVITVSLMIFLAA